jgi:phospholipid N-methyltransferase
MIVPIPFCHNNLIVELGAGNGCITQALLKKLEGQSKMISFELHPAFFNRIRHLSNEQCTIVNDNALNILNFVDSQSVDAIVS